MAAVRALRTESGDLGLIATLALIFLPFAIWLWASLRLPRGDLGWQERGRSVSPACNRAVIRTAAGLA